MKGFSSRMLIIDENISEIEVWRLREWRIPVRQIGPDVAQGIAGEHRPVESDL
jgi:hypothetical protein